ncbi:hypothetical protein L207DRAFT_186763 [Hyaloscypha variabilis F]|jgi:hypothetical protein|uniref:2EXR domain-containing protein n=1 Tax=Hyaloscypha variabilis (strain UAMH 11265 / GT02V1 / F) TaxID=1149755 RepID=A0A2J6QZX8_HYAVF|nr:hypothetical protein L207DRAFT_186763 [Hyaloscypha variabilis F]
MATTAPLTQFDDLPPELRQEIWSLVLPGPRLITVNRFSKPPLPLHINRESRSVALQHYELLTPQHPDDDEDGHPEQQKCVMGYIDFEVDVIHITGLRSCRAVNQKIRHLQQNSWLWEQISSARTFLMTDFAIPQFPRLRSHKTVVHFDPSIQGVEYRGLPGQLTEEEFQTRLQRGAEGIFRRLEAIKANKTQEGGSWEPPSYHFVRCERDAAGLKCEIAPSCTGTLGASDLEGL